jgi:hypothetical protein
VTLVLAQLTACTTWHPVSSTPDPQGGATHIAHARVRLRNGTELPLRDVTVGADSVIGYDEDSNERRAHPVADVGSIDRLQVSAGRSAAVAGSSVVVLAAVVGVTFLAWMVTVQGHIFGR